MGNGMQNSLVQHERTSLNTKDCLTDQDCYDKQGKYPSVSANSTAGKKRCCMRVEL